MKISLLAHKVYSNKPNRRIESSAGFAYSRRNVMAMLGAHWVALGSKIQGCQAEDWQSTDPQIAYCFHSRKDFALTADPSDRHWRYVSPIILSASQLGNPVANHRTEIRARWTQRYLYFLFSCQYKKLRKMPVPQKADDTSGLEEFEVVGFSLAPEPDGRNRYFKFEFSPNRQWLDLKAISFDPESKTAEEATWDSLRNAKHRMEESCRHWCVELRIPYGSLLSNSSHLPSAPFIGQEMRVNFFRFHGKGNARKHLAWSAAPSANFYNPNLFQPLLLVTK